jgi:hypothetical protein
MNDIPTVTEFVARFPGVTHAAKALGVDRVTLWRWQQGGDEFPGAWGYKAKGLRPKRPRASVDRQGSTNSRKPSP